MPEPLTPDFISVCFHKHPPIEKPIVQILIQKSKEDLPILAISDGTHYLHGVNAAAVILPKLAIIRLDSYLCTEINGQIFVVITELSLLEETADKVGEPIFADNDHAIPQTPGVYDSGTNGERVVSPAPDTLENINVDECTPLSKGSVQLFLGEGLLPEVVLHVTSVEHLPEFGGRMANGQRAYASTVLVVNDGERSMEAISIDPMEVNKGDVIYISKFTEDILWLGNRRGVPPVLVIYEYKVLRNVIVESEAIQEPEAILEPEVIQEPAVIQETGKKRKLDGTEGANETDDADETTENDEESQIAKRIRNEPTDGDDLGLRRLFGNTPPFSINQGYDDTQNASSSSSTSTLVPSKPLITAIRDMQVYESYTILVRVSNRTATNNGMFSVRVRDSVDNFRIMVNKKTLYDKLVPGHSYYITGVRMVLERDLLVFLSTEPTASVEPCAPEDCLRIEYVFEPLATRKEGHIDAIGIVDEVGELVEVTTNSQKERRTITLLDDSGYTSLVVFWGQRAIDLDCRRGDVLAFSDAVRNVYRAEYMLEVRQETDIDVNPDLDECARLQEWYMTQDIGIANYKRLLVLSPLSVILDTSLWISDDPLCFAFEGRITRFDREIMMYPTCCKCNKKMVTLDAMWMCIRCIFSTKKPSYSYLLRVNVSDGESDVAMTMFDETGELLLLVRADDFIKLSQEEQEKRIEVVLPKRYQFVCTIDFRASQSDEIASQITIISIAQIQ